MKGGRRPLRQAPPYPPKSSRKMLEEVEERALEKFDRDFRSLIGHTSPDRVDTHLTVSSGL